MEQIVELKSKLVETQGGNGELRLLVELRINPDDVDDERVGTFQVGITEATLVVDLSGLEVVPKSRYGDAQVGGVVRTEVETQKAVTASAERLRQGAAELSLGVSATGPNAGFKGNRAGSDKEGSVENSTRIERGSEQFYPVRALTANRWKLSTKGGAPLDGTFLNEDALCNLSAIPKQNRVASEMQLVAKQRHISVKLEKEPAPSFFRGFQTVNQKKLMNVLIARSLHARTSAAPYAGELVFSKSAVTDEG